ncbi:MAG: AMP-binding protein [Pseudomonadota bacterium]
MTQINPSNPIWKPDRSRIDNSNLMHFMRVLNGRWQQNLQNYQDIHRFSIDEPNRFWKSFWQYANILGQHHDENVISQNEFMGRCHYFENATFNYAENLLRSNKSDEAIFFKVEDFFEKTISWQLLYQSVAEMANAMRKNGIKKNDVIAAIIPNCPQAIIALLASASIGAIWTSCSPDFGVQGVLDRFGQTKPKLLIAALGYRYNGKIIHIGFRPEC